MKALFFCGGWDGHEPKLVTARFSKFLESQGFEVVIQENHDCLENLDDILQYDVIFMSWTMGDIKNTYKDNIIEAVARGVGIVGCHGGMCDAFRYETDWQFMTGGQWVSHPGCDGVNYKVNVIKNTSPITEGIEDFDVCSEHYYLHVDPCVEVLATTRFPLVNNYNAANKPVDMPVVWTKMWGIGRVFYTSLGHHDDVFDKSPSAEIILQRGILWAAEGKKYAAEHGLSYEKYKNNDRLYVVQ